MRVNRLLAGIAAIAVVVAGFAAVPAGAATFNPGEFQVQMSPPQEPGQGNPGGGDEGMAPDMNCVDENGDAVDLFGGDMMSLLQDLPQGGMTLECGTEMTMEFASMEQEGTVTNAKVDDAPGTISMVCDIKQDMAVSFGIAISGGFPPDISFDKDKFAMSMTGFQACTWTMQFKDAAQSKLSGSIAQVMDMNSKNGKVECPEETLAMMGDLVDSGMMDIHCVKMTLTADITVVGGTGYFADMSGTGSFTDNQYIPMPIPNGSMGGGGGGGGGGAAEACEASGGTWDAVTNICEMGDGGGGGGGGGFTVTQEFCEAAIPNGLNGTWTGTGCQMTVPNEDACASVTGNYTWDDGTCIVSAPGRAAMQALGRSLGRALSRADDSSGMTMKLVKNGGPKVALVAPLKINKKITLGKAPDGSNLTLKAVAAPGSRCAITGSYAKKRNISLMAAKTYANGQIVTTITGATLKTKLGTPKGKAADIDVSCTLGSGKKAKKFSTKASIIVG
jgi:hypothetical protein